MKHTLVGAAVGAIAATLIAGGVAWATIPAATGVINACYRISEDDQKGQVRLVNEPSSCRNNEAPISWNQVGRQGDRGPQGEPGPAGRDGANGADGADGASVTTAAEASGVNCLAGGVQLTAVNGVSYVCNGLDGEDGEDGADGADGADGLNGIHGSNGVSVTSANEPAGANCANGGSRFTAVNGVTFACHGAAGGGGSSAGYTAFSGVLPGGGVLGAGDVTIVSRTLPPGKYLVFAKAQLTGTGSGGIINCGLKNGVSFLDNATMLVDGSRTSVVTLMGHLSAPTSVVVNVNCGVSGSGNAFAGIINAIRVDTLDGT